MAMKERGGTKQNQKGMPNVFQSTFSRSEMKQRSRICTCKTERTLQISGKCVFCGFAICGPNLFGDLALNFRKSANTVGVKTLGRAKTLGRYTFIINFLNL